MVLECSAFYTGSEEQLQPISFELACASEMQKIEKEISVPSLFHHFTAYVPM